MVTALNYTKRMESCLPWGGLDDETEDYQPLLDWLNSKAFRSFGDGLLSFMQAKNSELTVEGAIQHIEKCCSATGVSIADIASANTLKSWFEGGPRPKKGEDSRRAMFALAFAFLCLPSRCEKESIALQIL